MAYGIHELELEGLRVKTILSVRIRHEAGRHGEMELEADMGQEDMDLPVLETGSGQSVVLSGRKDGKWEPLFCGTITGLEAEGMGQSCRVKVTAKTWSYRMDIEKKSRSFQDTSMTYGTLVSRITGEYPGAECRILFRDMPLGEIAVQYQETDWQFLKRLLSGLHVPLVCSEVRENLSLYAGVARIPAHMDIVSVESVHKDMEGLAYWRETGEVVADTDFITYRAKLDNHVPLYAEVDFRSRELAVCGLEYLTEGSTLYEFPVLRKAEGILQESVYPVQLVGSALEGTVREVRGENVKIHLKIDDGYPCEDCYWFPVSTPSASSDGSGWYCMPEVGDQIRVYFPSRKTGDVIAVSAVSSYLPPTDMDNSGREGNGGEPDEGWEHAGNGTAPVTVGQEGATAETGMGKTGQSDGSMGEDVKERRRAENAESKDRQADTVPENGEGGTGIQMEIGKIVGGEVAYSMAVKPFDKLLEMEEKGKRADTGKIPAGDDGDVIPEAVWGNGNDTKLAWNSQDGQDMGKNSNYYKDVLERWEMGLQGTGEDDTASGPDPEKRTDKRSDFSTREDRERRRKLGVQGELAGLYAASALENAEKGKDKMSDSATKYLCTVDGQEIILAPEGITVQCGGGGAKIEIRKNGQINVYAKFKVDIRAARNVAFLAKNFLSVQSQAQTFMEASEGGIFFDMKGNIKIKGEELHMN